MSRRQQTRERRAIEAELTAELAGLRRSGRARVAVLRGLGPGWLIGGGFVTGVLVHQLGRQMPASRWQQAAVQGLRWWPIFSSVLVSPFLAGDLGE